MCGEGSFHVLTFNALHAFLLARGRLAHRAAERIVVTMDSRPLSLLCRARGVPVPLVQGASLRREVVAWARNFDRVFIVGGSRSDTLQQQLRASDAACHVTAYHGACNSELLRALQGTIARELPGGSRVMVLLFLPATLSAEYASALSEAAHGRRVVTLGLGGALDMWEGVNPRAPRWMQRLLLEGGWRLLQQPSWYRLRRLIDSLLGILLFPRALRQLARLTGVEPPERAASTVPTPVTAPTESHVATLATEHARAVRSPV